jgi:hypothetical protein
MANLKPGLVTGSNAKLKIAGRTMAYATDVQYSVDVAVVPVEVMGRYEVITNEPIATSVNGSFTVVRYTAGNANVPDAAKSGNGVGQFGNGGASGGNQANAFNPGQMLSSSTVDIEIYQRKSDAGFEKTTPLVKIQDCRLTRLSSSLNKRGIMTESYQFVGILYGDDSFIVQGTTTGGDLSP